MVKREVVRLVTSGTVTEDTLLPPRSNNYLLCLTVVKNSLGASWIDISTGQFYSQEIIFEDRRLPFEINSILTRLDPSEILLADAFLERSDLFSIFNRIRDKISVLPRARFNVKSAEKRIKDFFGVQSIDSFGTFSVTEITSIGVLLDYADMTQRGKMPRIEHPHKIMDGDFMEIDGSTRENLNLVAAGKQKDSLINVIDCTITPFGARKLAMEMLNPLVDAKAINERLNAVEFFINHQQLRESLRKLLRGCFDLERAICWQLPVQPSWLRKLNMPSAHLLRLMNLINFRRRLVIFWKISVNILS